MPLERLETEVSTETPTHEELAQQIRALLPGDGWEPMPGTDEIRWCREAPPTGEVVGLSYAYYSTKPWTVEIWGPIAEIRSEAKRVTLAEAYADARRQYAATLAQLGVLAQQWAEPLSDDEVWTNKTPDRPGLYLVLRTSIERVYAVGVRVNDRDWWEAGWIGYCLTTGKGGLDPLPDGWVWGPRVPDHKTCARLARGHNDG